MDLMGSELRFWACHLWNRHVRGSSCEKLSCVVNNRLECHA